MILSIAIPIIVIVSLAAVVAAVIFFGMKLRSGAPLSVPLRSLLTVYFYLLSIAGLIVLLIGLSGLVNAGLGALLGRDFSYQRTPVGVPAVPLMSPEGVPQRQFPSPEELTQESYRQQERQAREVLLQGISMTVVGGLVWALHMMGRRKTETAEERRAWFLHTAYLAILLAICSIVGIITLASGVYDTLRFYLLQPPGQFEYRTPPGQSLSAALVFAPAWAYYLVSLLRDVRQRQRA